MGSLGHIEDDCRKKRSSRGKINQMAKNGDLDSLLGDVTVAVTMDNNMHASKGAMASTLQRDKQVNPIINQRWTPKDKAKGVAKGTSHAKDDYGQPLGPVVVDVVDNSPIRHIDAIGSRQPRLGLPNPSTEVNMEGVTGQSVPSSGGDKEDVV